MERRSKLLLWMLLLLAVPQMVWADWSNTNDPTGTIKFWNDPAYNNAQTNYHFEWKTYDDFTVDEYMRSAKLYYQIVGEDSGWHLIFDMSVSRAGEGSDHSVVNYQTNGDDHGAITGYNCWWDGGAGTKDRYMKMDWHIPNRVTGKTIKIKLDYGWEEHKSSTVYRTMEWTKTIATLPKANVSIEHTSPTELTMNYVGATVGTTIFVNGNSYDKVTSANGSVKITHPANKDFVANYDFQHSVASGKPTGLIYSDANKLSVSRIAQPTNLNYIYVPCDEALTLSWDINLAPDQKHSIFVERSRGETMASPTVIGELTTGETKFVDYEAEAGVRYCYRVSHLPDDWRKDSNNGLCALLKAEPAVAPLNLVVSSIDVDVAKRQFTINWDEAQWCEQSELILIKNDRSNNRKEEISVKKEDLKYVDTYVNTCTDYHYSIRMTNLGKTYESNPKSAQLSDDVSFKSLAITKGVYSDRVELKWGVDNPQLVKEYIVYRKELSEEAGAFKEMIRKTDNSSMVVWEDRTAVSGKYYNYRVEARVVCLDASTSTSIDEIGFVQSTGTVSGRVSFSGGTAVENTCIVLRRISDGDILSTNYALKFNGKAYAEAHWAETHLFQSTDFSLQFYMNPMEQDVQEAVLLKNGTDFSASIVDEKLQVTFGGTVLDVPMDTLYNKYSQITLVRNQNQVSLYVDARLAIEKSYVSSVSDKASVLVIGDAKVNGTNGYKGCLDELRVWNRALTKDMILKNHEIALSGTEQGLIAYWQFNEQLNTHFFDLSHTNFDYNGNDGLIQGAVSTDIVPTEKQLALKAYTDKSGNYIIRGIPYELYGTTYTIVPMLGVHQFDPHQHQVHIGGGGLSVINGLDIVDISSFTVTGKAEYRGTRFPVEGATLYVDGQAVVKDGEMITTGADGKYTIQVPIGEHFVEVRMANHGFIDNGRYPAKPGVKYDFQNDLTINFTDTTLVKVAGRVVGGRIQADFPIGFGKSRNNIGNAEIRLSPKKSHKMTVGEDPQKDSFTSGAITSTMETYPDYVRVFADTKTGEYVAYLLPEEYNVTHVGTMKYTLPKEQLTPMDLKNLYEQSDTISDTLRINMPDGTIVEEIKKDTFYYHLSRSYTYYEETPVLEVTQIGKPDAGVFGEAFYYYKQDDGKMDSIPLYEKRIFEEDNDAVVYDYTMGAPIFRQMNPYRFRLKAYEEYINPNDANKEDRVPVVEGKWLINNELSQLTEDPNSATTLELEMDSTGVNIYVFQGGLPNLVEDPMYPENNYKRDYSVRFKTTANKVVEGVGLKAYLLGAMPTGNNFTTTGPDIITTILRDPTGSGSTATFEAGTEVSKTVTTSESGLLGNEDEVKFKAGLKTATGFGVLTFSESKFDMAVGIEWELNWNKENSYTVTTSTTKTYSTSDDPDYVGSDGDLFIGTSTNIIYGAAVDIDFYKSDDVKLESTNGMEYKGLTIGKKKAFRSDMSFGTTFVYDQAHIKNNVIPSLELLRSQMFIYDPNPEGYTNTTERALYVTSLKPDDENFGKNNDDEVWEEDTLNMSIEERTALKFNGKSYKLVLPNGQGYDSVIDSVRFFNSSIASWTDALLRNEKEKIEAYKEDPYINYSFSPGVGEIAEEMTSCDEKGYSQSFDYQILGHYLYEQGFDAAGVGYELSVQANFGGGNGESEDGSESNCTTYSFTLADNDPNDALTVDVYKSKTGGGPIFRTRAGQTSCPYQGEELTEYYRRGREKIQEATMRVEVPSLSATKTVVADVPGGSGAVFEVLMANLPETDFMAQSQSLRLKVDDATNPDGAVLSIDGAVLNGEGILFWMPDGGEVMKKSLIMKQSRTDITKYENVNLILTSDCEDGLEVSLPISAYFKPTSTSFKMTTDEDRRIVNGITGDTLRLTITDYDRNYENFAGIALEYKPESASSWITEAYFANTQAEFDRMEGNKYTIDGATIEYKWGMTSLIDRNYMVRARSLSKSNEGAFIADYVGTPITVIKDMKSPKELGLPNPSDGILKPGMNIGLTFNEQIMKSLVTDYNISVEGELNGHEISNNVGLEFDGNENAMTEANLNLVNKSFCIEMWLKREIGKNGVILSHGETSPSMSVGFDANDYLHLYYNGKDIKSRIPVSEKGWMHLAISYNVASETVTAVVAAQSINERDKEIIKDASFGAYTVNGRLKVGSSFDTKLGTGNFYGYMNELRIWSKDRSMAEITAENALSLSGLENGLMAYWPMNEANGVIAKEKVGSKHMLMDCQWYVNPKGYGVTFDGKSQYLKVPAHLFPMLQDNSYTIEFWFKGEQQADARMLTYGKSIKNEAGIVESQNILGLGVNGDGKLVVQAEKKTYQVSDKIFLDNQWHHLALVVNRASKGNVYVDGNLYLSIAANELPALTAPYMFVGASGDGGQMYKGSIDELRVWSTALNAEQIRLDMGNKLEGDESGLKAYYPFETYVTDNAGVQTLQPVLTDQMVISSLMQPQVALVVGEDPLSGVSATVKETRQREKVNFTYTVSDNSIVIDVTEPISRIENCTLEFMINGVEDMYGNQQTSPIKWTAYVNLNTLKWDSKSLAFEKKVQEEFSFDVSIVNQSGNKESFVIENIPSWLTLSEFSGTLQPLENKVLTCTVNPSLNIGRYEEILYLRGNSDITSPLILSMKVNGEKPDWSVNPKDFDLAMNLVGSLRIEDVLSTDKDDIVAAFNGDKCVGVAQSEYIVSHDFYALFMTIYGNENSAKEITFKVWDASTGRVYPTVEPRVLIFKNDSIAGTLDEPVLLNALDEIQLTWNLHKGWNWTSVNVENEYLSKPYLLLESVQNSVGYVKGYGTNSMIFDPAAPGHHWSGSLVDKGFKPSEGYKMQSSDEVSLNIVGKASDPSKTVISLAKDWNWIGYVPATMMNVNEALANLSAQDGDVIKSQTDFALYYRVNGGWIGSLKYMKPGDGYMYKSVSEKSFTYPAYTTKMMTKVRSRAEETALNSPNWTCDVYKYSENMSVVAAVCKDEQLLENNRYEIAAFVNDECRGISQLVDNRLFLTIHSSVRNEVVNLRLFDKETVQEFMLHETIAFSGDLLGTMADPYLVDLDKAATGISSEYGLSIYPNPVMDWLYIEGLDDSVGSIKILDISGRIVYLNDGLPVDNRLDVAHLPDATYVLVIETTDRTVHKKFIKGNNK